MAETKATAKLGATRLYKAIADNNVGMVQMYLLSLSSDDNTTVQGFQYKKAYDAWVDGGRPPDMLQALLSYQPLSEYRSRRYRNGLSNGSFSFTSVVTSYLEKVFGKTDPDAEDLVQAREFIGILKTHDITCDASNLRERLNDGKEWPYPLLAASRAMSNQILSNGQHLTDTAAFVEWYLDMFGPFADVDNKMPELSWMLNEKYFLLFLRLVPTKATQKKLFKTWQYKRIVESAVAGYKKYVAMKPFIPWIDELGEKE